MPPDFGFAIVDESGKVLFHSNSSRNQSENFFTESGNQERLRAAALSESDSLLNLYYQGIPHAAYVTPFSEIASCPWRLIVFRDLTAVTARHVDRILLFGVLALAYSAILALLAQCCAPIRWIIRGRGYGPRKTRRAYTCTWHRPAVATSDWSWTLEGEDRVRLARRMGAPENCLSLWQRLMSTVKMMPLAAAFISEPGIGWDRGR
jgi:hypothetical protein